MSKKLLIFGDGEIADLAFFYFSKKSEFNISGFVVDNPKQEKFKNLPLIPSKELENKFPNDEYLVHVALSYQNLNRNRQDKFKYFEDKNYSFASYISDKATVLTKKENLGRNLFILEEQSIQTGVKIGDNVVIWSNNHIGHGSFIGSHTYISSNVTISGHCKIGERCFFGVNSCVSDFCEIGDDCFVTMGSVVSQNLKNDSTTINKSTLVYEADSKVNRVLKKNILKLKMKFKSLGIIFKPKKKYSWSLTYSMLPTVFKLNRNKIRIFFGSRNKNNVSSIGFIDLKYNKNKFEIIKHSNKPVLTAGLLGSFDDNGVLPSCIIKKNKLFYLFYIGWRPSVTTRYSLIAGVAKSKNLTTFKRVSRSPVLNLNDKEPYQILTAPTVIKKNKEYYMWYVSCNEWKNKDLPYYDIKFATSKNLTEWKQTGISCIKLRKGERAVARPFVIYEKNLFKMWYCYEKKVDGYKIGYGESLDGKKWARKDNKIEFVNSSVGENEMRAYPNLIRLAGDTLMFYNGNNYGEKGIFCAKLEN